MSTLKFVISIFLALALGGCATVGTIDSRDIDQGITQSFNAPYETVLAATTDTMSRLNVNVISVEEKDAGAAIKFSKAVNAFSWGEIGRVSVLKSTGSETRVVVTSVKRSRAQITGTSEGEFAKKIFKGVSNTLVQLQ